MHELYFIAFFLGFFISFTSFYGVNKVFPLSHLGEVDEVDCYGTFTAQEAARHGVLPVQYAEATWSDENKGQEAHLQVTEGSSMSLGTRNETQRVEVVSVRYG